MKTITSYYTQVNENNIVVNCDTSSVYIIFRLGMPRNFLYVNKSNLKRCTCGVNINNKTLQSVLDKTVCSSCR